MQSDVCRHCSSLSLYLFFLEIPIHPELGLDSNNCASIFDQHCRRALARNRHSHLSAAEEKEAGGSSAANGTEI